MISLSRLRGTSVVLRVFSVIIVKPARKLWYLRGAYILSVHTLCTPIFLGEKCMADCPRDHHIPSTQKQQQLRISCASPDVLGLLGWKKRPSSTFRLTPPPWTGEKLQHLLQQQDSIALEMHPATAKEPVWSIYGEDRRALPFLESSSRCSEEWL